jgi:hypothetical protein
VIYITGVGDAPRYFARLVWSLWKDGIRNKSRLQPPDRTRESVCEGGNVFDSFAVVLRRGQTNVDAVLPFSEVLYSCGLWPAGAPTLLRSGRYWSRLQPETIHALMVPKHHLHRMCANEGMVTTVE